MNGLLAGVRVVDLSRMLPGGVLAQLLADLGADVVKVERPGTGEETREFGPPVAGTRAGHAFMDRGKRSVAVDLRDPRGVRAVRALVGDADVVLESFRPGVADRLGVGFDDLIAVNPGLVYCSVNGYGSGGPRDREPGHDLNYLAYAGASHFGGSRTHGPALGGIQAADVIGGLTGGIGLLAALVGVRSGGEGCHVEVALADAALWAMGIHVSSWLAGGEASGPESTPVTGASPSYRVYECADGRHLAVGAVEARFWTELTEVLGRPDLAARQHDPSAVQEVADVVATRPLGDWVERLAGRETCATPVQHLEDVLADPQYRARGMIVPVVGGDGVRQVGTPVRVDGRAPARVPAAATRVGQHTDEVFATHDLPPDVLDGLATWTAASAVVPSPHGPSHPEPVVPQESV